MMRINIEQGMKGMYDALSAVVIPTLCDTLKCISDNWKVAVPHIPSIPLVHPQNRKVPAGMAYLVEEYGRLQRDIEAVAGTKITEEALDRSITLYEDCRKTLRSFTALSRRYPKTLDAKTRHRVIKAGYFMDKGRYREMIKELVDELQRCPEEEGN